MAKSIYEGDDVFRLYDMDGVVLSAGSFQLIYEPDGFGTASITLKRENLGGFNFEFGDADTKLGFDGELGQLSGRSLIKQIYNVKGSDLNVMLEYLNNGNVIYQGFIIGSSLEDIDYKTIFRVRRIDFGNKLKTRFKTPINLESTEDLDGNANTALDLIDTDLFSRPVLQREKRDSVELAFQEDHIDQTQFGPVDLNYHFNFQTEIDFSGQDLVLNNSEKGILMFDASEQEIGAIDNFVSRPYSVFFNVDDRQAGEAGIRATNNYEFGGAVDKFPWEVQQFTIDFQKEVGFVNLDYNVDFDHYTRFLFTKGVDVLVRLILVPGITDPENTEQDQRQVLREVEVFSETITEVSDLVRRNFQMSGSYTGDMRINRGEKLYMYLDFSFSSNGVQVDTPCFFEIYSVNALSIDLSVRSYENASTTKVASYFDTLDKALTKATGSPNILESSLFTGCGNLDYVSGGNKIRGYETNFVSKIEDLISHAKARYGCEYAIEDRIGGKKFVLEKANHFFQNKKIATLSNVHDGVVKRINKTLLYNEIEAGYNKYARTNESGSIQGFLTRHNYVTPISKDENKLSLLNKLVADGSEIERLRRQGIAQVETQADEKDKDTFLIRHLAYNSSNPFTPVDDNPTLSLFVNFLDDLIEVRGLLLGDLLSAGDKIYYDQNTAFPKNDEILTVTEDLVSYKTILTFADPNSLNSFAENYNTFYFTNNTDEDIDIIRPQGSDGFSNISGLFEASREYNIYHSITQYIINNFMAYGSSLAKKLGTDSILFIDKINNIDLIKAFDSVTDCVLTTDTISEIQNFDLTTLRGYNPPIFNEFEYEIKIQMGFEEFLRTKEALRNESEDDINYGFHEHPDPDGVLVESYMMSIEYNPLNLETTCILWGKA
jgi:hypothetical protein